ncbi:DUF6988 family protein [Dyella nitratireducens]|uniref:AbiV family abortive infection protein n=1 Tax=Dyella nitratireducens TaxID=1849580 RepID=A0ABQ1FNY3_9GAMM|nr:hypothetical protein [Dyella nitratireducens]GGA21900.1 hypothetical protein GCM10010981_07560 [Dyella nitratireducens]GLQ44183.1 hypothetical protein GCM10007902_40330 [Dyella nitratireducens]
MASPTPQAPIRMEQTKQAADLAVAAIKAVLVAIAGFPIPASKRNALSVALLRASIDHAHALALLIAIHPWEFGSSSLALHRVQIETLLRGAFFAKEATDDEVEYFIKHDEMPKRPNKDGQSKRLNHKTLAPLVGDVLAVGSSTKIVDMVQYSWDVLCGMVHGGKSTLITYTNEQIGFRTEPGEIVEVVGNALALAHLAMVGVCYVSTADDQEKSDLFQEPRNTRIAFRDYLKSVFPKPSDMTGS